MTLEKRMQQVKANFIQGSIAVEDLHLHVEPWLMSLAQSAEEESEVQTIINGIERIIYTQLEPQKTDMIVELLDQAINFVTRHES